MTRIANFKRGGGAILLKLARWHLSHYLGGKEFPLAATFQLTNRCNLRCIMCNIPNNPQQGVLALGDFRKIIRELSELGCCYASLSGGEVLTIANFFDYLYEAKSNLPSVNFVTNGLLMDGAAAREAARAGADSVSVSLDGLEKTHELIRNMAGSFQRTLSAIENLKRFAPRARVVVNTVITPWNIDELYDLTEFVEGLGVLQKFQPLNEHPRFDGQLRAYAIERKIDVEKVRKFTRYLARKKNVANSKYFLRSIPDYFAGANRSGLFGERCKLPRFFCEFREDGNMYPCLGGTGWRDGYPASRGIGNIFHSAEYRENIRKLEGCTFCQKSYSVCYIEPRVNFPFPNFLKYRFLERVPGLS